MRRPLLTRAKSLLTASFSNHSPLRYLFSRLAINYPSLFSLYKVQRDGYKLNLSQSSLLSGMISEGPSYLINQERLICSLLRGGSFFLDVGANIGNLSLAAAAKFPDCRICAIEANPHTYKSLVNNVLLNNSSVETYNFAIGSLDAVPTSISHSVYDDWNCILENVHFSDEVSHTRLVENTLAPEVVFQRTLDSLSRQYHWPEIISLLKIDIEGYELFALNGALSLLAKTQMILLELSSSHCSRYGYTTQEVFQLLSSFGFTIYLVSAEAQTLEDVLLNLPLSSALSAPSYCDVLAVRPSIVCSS